MITKIENIRSSAHAGDAAAQFQLAVLHLHVESETDVDICERPNDFQCQSTSGLNLLKQAARNDNKDACELLGKILMSPEIYFIHAQITDLNREQMHSAGVHLLNYAGTLNDNKQVEQPKSFLSRLATSLFSPTIPGQKMEERHWDRVNHATDMLVTSIGRTIDQTSFYEPHRAVA